MKNSKNPTKLQSVVNAKSSRAFKVVLRCLEINICELFQGCFELQQHKKQTRNSKLDKVPRHQNRVCQEVLLVHGLQINKELQINLRKTESFKKYEELLKKHIS